MGTYILDKSKYKDILTEIDEEILYDNSSNKGEVKKRDEDQDDDVE